jgi:hypothetical protein
MSERNNIVKSVDANTKLKIYQDSVTGVFKFKGLLANKYNISTRTLGRILKEMEAQEEHPNPTILTFVYDYTVTKEAITIFCNEDSRVVTKGYPKFKTIREKLISSDFDDQALQETFELLSLPTFIEKFSEGNITVSHEEGKIYYGSFEIKNSLVVHMFDIISRGEDVMPMVRFLDMLMDNPKADIVEELYGFMQHNGIEISEDGFILGFKGVKSNYNDVWTNTISNAIGQKPCMPRSQVVYDPKQGCGAGLHAGSLKYAKGWSEGHVMKLKINPRDVVSVPYDCDAQKMRTCGYEVIGEV